MSPNSQPIKPYEPRKSYLPGLHTTHDTPSSRTMTHGSHAHRFIVPPLLSLRKICESENARTARRHAAPAPSTPAAANAEEKKCPRCGRCPTCGSSSSPPPAKNPHTTPSPHRSSRRPPPIDLTTPTNSPPNPPSTAQTEMNHLSTALHAAHFTPSTAPKSPEEYTAAVRGFVLRHPGKYPIYEEKHGVGRGGREVPGRRVDGEGRRWEMVRDRDGEFVYRWGVAGGSGERVRRGDGVGEVLQEVGRARGDGDGAVGRE